MLEHVGRSTETARYAVLEVVSRPSRWCIIVASALGEHPALWKKLSKTIDVLHEGDSDFELPSVQFDVRHRPKRLSDPLEQK